MTQIFLSYTKDDEQCAMQLRGDLESHGYRVVPPVDMLGGPVVASQKVEQTIRGSAAVVLLWSTRAAHSEWVERHNIVAQRLKKRVVPIVIDGADLPVTLVNITAITSTPSCADAGEQLLHWLAALVEDDLLDTLLLQSSHEYIRERKAAIQRAGELLQRGEDSEPLLAMLEDIARNDLMQTVRDLAQGVLDAQAQRHQPTTHGSAESRHIIGAKCPRGHVSYFDKRVVCPANGTIVRNVRQSVGSEVDDLYLKCNDCNAEMIVPVDCEGYK